MSFIDVPHNLSFVHIPITSGAIWSRWFHDPGLIQCSAHDSAEVMRRNHQELWRKSIKCAVVRNPWAWWLSAYFHYDFKDRYASFREFLLNRRDWWMKSFPLTTQSVMICDGAGRVLVDYVGRTEDLQGACDYMRCIAGLPILELPTKPRRKLAEWYDEELKEIVADLSAADIRIFNYKFEDHP